jgi:3-vinyl bacteriochlorophyllide hydratase
MRCSKQKSSAGITPIYSAQERERRDRSVWTKVQAVLAPLQFIIFLVSAALITRYLVTSEGLGVAAGSVVVKTAALYLIMLTGSIWEKDIFGVYLFAPAFFWEDVISLLVLALHTAYIVMWFKAEMNESLLLGLAIAAYCSYLVNAGQFLWKFRAARLLQQSLQVAREVATA